MDKSIPFVDVAAETARLRLAIDEAIARVLDSGNFVLGPEVVAFERALATVTGAESAIGVSSGTDALLVALMALNVGPGDEVVTTPFTFFATAGVVARLGAKPVFADIVPGGFLLDPRAAATQCSDRTRAVIPVNLYGELAELPDVDIPVVEDAAQSIGVGGCRGAAACLSFFPTKNVGALGDAGAVLVNDTELADRVRKLRAHGAHPKYFHALVGGNFRIDALQAAVLGVKLAHLADVTKARRLRASRYRERLREARIPPEVLLPAHGDDHVYHQFTLQVPRRDELRAALAQLGVATEVYYPQPLHLQECFTDLGYRPGSLPHAERAAATAISLPIHPALPDGVEDRVVAAIESFYRT